jgi:hypothetical protein
MGMGFHELGRVWVGKNSTQVGGVGHFIQLNPNPSIPFLKVDFDG